jgi:hypothetical protein
MITFTKYLFALASIVLLASCKKILDTEPTHQLDGTASFNNISDYDFALTGAYSLFRSNYYYGANGGSNSYVTLPDILSDNFNETPESLGNFNELTTWNFAEDEVNIDSTWQSAYRIILQANIVLRGIDKFSDTKTLEVNRIKGQALAIRAMVHFDILRYWAEDFDRNSTKPGIPYIVEFNYEAKPGRGTVKDTYDHIEADLMQALALISKTDRPVNSNGRAYIDATVVNAILARMYLYSRQYDNAIKYASVVINDIPLADRSEFPAIWTDASLDEVIWSVPFNSGQGSIGDNIYFTSINASSYRPNPTLVSTYDQAADIRYPTYFAEVPTNSGTSTRQVLSKYLAKGSQLSRPDGVVDFKCLRTAEMYLIRAEAYARKGGSDVLALQDLNDLRAARIDGFLPGKESGTALLAAIELERRKELIGEGHRWFDLKRTSRTINRANCNNFCTLTATNRAWALPVPFSEMNANSNMVQNSGY